MKKELMLKVLMPDGEVTTLIYDVANIAHEIMDKGDQLVICHAKVGSNIKVSKSKLADGEEQFFHTEVPMPEKELKINKEENQDAT